MKKIINIVYVENNNDYVQVVKNIDISKDINFTVLENGYDLINLLSQCRESDIVYPDLIFINYSLPDKNGLELLKLIRKKFLYLPSPIIIVASNGSEIIAKEVIRQGASDYIVKDEEYIQKVKYFVFDFFQNKKRINTKETYLVSFKVSPLTGPLILSSESNIPFTEDELIKMGLVYSALLRQPIEKETDKYRKGLFGPLPVPQTPEYRSIVYSTFLPNELSHIKKTFCIFCLIYPTRKRYFFENNQVLEIHFKHFTIHIPRIRAVTTNLTIPFKLRLLHALENTKQAISHNKDIKLDLIMFFKEIDRLATLINDIQSLDRAQDITTEEIQNLKIMKDQLLTKIRYT